VERYLKAKNVPYEKEDVTNNTPLREGLRQKTGYSQVPVTTDGKTYVVGFKPGQLAELVRGLNG
jgi:glutaredoxin